LERFATIQASGTKAMKPILASIKISVSAFTLEQQIWLMAGVFLTIALIVALIEGPRFIRKPVASIEIRATRSIANRSM
jgi:hypothetical protein